MTNGSNNANEGSSNVPSQPEQSPRRGSGSRNSSPRGRGSPSAPQRPIMGVPGRSAFSAYVRPPPPQPRWFSPGPGGPSGSGTAGGYGFHGALGVPVGGSGSGAVAAPGVLIGGSPSARKRVRDGGADAAGGANPPPRDGAPNEVHCSICGKVFWTPKALFGHMRSHPERGWRGARPPPTFRADEEFADLHDVGDAAPEEGGGGEDNEANYRVPDLNNPPPPDSGY